MPRPGAAQPAAEPAAPAASDDAGLDNPLTTKEGWRRFVDKEPAPPPLLGEAERAALSTARRVGYDEARVDYHADLPLVNTPVIRQVVATSRLLIQLNRRQISARRGAIISGASGTGKTTALSQLGRAHELAARRRHHEDRHRLPVVYITVPPAATPRMVAVEFARFFGLFAGTRGRQIAGRFTLIPARPFAYGTAEQRETWRGLVSTMEASLRLHRHEPGTLTGLDEYLFARTSGMIGSLSQLVRGAAVLAIQDGTEQITKELLDLVPVDHAAHRASSQRPRRRGTRTAKGSA